MSALQDLLDALTVERYDQTWWTTKPPPSTTASDDELAPVRRRRALLDADHTHDAKEA